MVIADHLKASIVGFYPLFLDVPHHDPMATDPESSGGFISPVSRVAFDTDFRPQKPSPAVWAYAQMTSAAVQFNIPVHTVDKGIKHELKIAWAESRRRRFLD